MIKKDQTKYTNRMEQGAESIATMTSKNQKFINCHTPMVVFTDENPMRTTLFVLSSRVTINDWCTRIYPLKK